MTQKTAFTTNLCQTLSITSLITLPLSALGTRFEFWDYKIGMAMYAISLLFAFVTVILVALTSRFRSAAERKQLNRSSITALPPILITAILMGSTSDAPRIHDITTDLKNPPQFIAAIERRGSESNPLNPTAETAHKQRQAYPELLPTMTALSAEEAFGRAVSVAQDMGWDIYASEPSQGRFEAVDTTFWFGFKDDVVVRITAKPQGSIIDLRSVSRVGDGDLGTNAKRIRNFLARFTEAE